jgi:4-hydroxythreonine-4-phosphate dehydrogenase|tara:strand:- start:1434 stop:2411 length:978 start_codon:yes stop_codon:yes gene_type:complete
MNKKIIAVTIGDINGIGIEILIKLWKTKKINNFILITNKKLFTKYLINKKIKLIIRTIINYDKNEFKKINNKYFSIFDIKAKNNNDNTYNSLLESYKLNNKNLCKGIITLPLNKNIISKKINNKFVGQTEFFEKLNNKKYTNMIFYSKKIIVSPLTTHIPINNINKKLKNMNFILKKIEKLILTLKNDFSIKNPKIALAGLNPHAGENGIIGYEENKYIIPVINKLKKEKIFIDGPFAADSLFTKKNIKYYDCFLCCYHDQALIPFKILSKFNGINYTGSLDIVRVSPVHGTAYDIVGLNKAKTNSLLYCFKLTKKIIKNRLKIV